MLVVRRFGADKRPELEDRDISWNIAIKRSIIKALPKTLRDWAEAVEKALSQVRAWVEHPFHIVKNLFRHKRLRYRGLAKNTAQLRTLFALANLVIVKKTLLAEGQACHPKSALIPQTIHKDPKRTWFSADADHYPPTSAVMPRPSTRRLCRHCSAFPYGASLLWPGRREGLLSLHCRPPSIYAHERQENCWLRLGTGTGSTSICPDNRTHFHCEE